MFRTKIEPNSSTLYEGDNLGRKKIIKAHSGDDFGIKENDYLFSESDPSWIEDSDEYGLSFSSTFNQTKFTHNLLGRMQKKKTKDNVAYWIVED